MKINQIKTRSAFTLVEMLAVIAILAVLAGFGFGTYFLVNKNAKITQAQVMINNLSASLEARAIQTKTPYPEGDGSDSSSNELYRFLSGDLDGSGQVDDDEKPAFPQIDPEYDGKGKYLNKSLLIIDAWATPIRYAYNEEGDGLNNNVEDGFDIWSAGPDKEFGNEDDVNNW